MRSADPFFHSTRLSYSFFFQTTHTESYRDSTLDMKHLHRSLLSIICMMLMMVMTAFSAHAQSTGTQLITPAASVFTKGNPGSPTGAFYSVQGWGNTGNRTLGWDSVHTGGGLWIQAVRPVSTGSVSNLGWAAPKTNGLIAAMPSTCTKQQIDITYSFYGREPWTGTGTAGLQIAFGNFIQFVPWLVEPMTGTTYTKSYQTDQAPGTYYVYLSYTMGLKQGGTYGTGIRIQKFQITCL